MSKRLRDYVSSDMNWQGALLALCLLALLIADFAILGSTTAGFVGAAVIVLVAGFGLRTRAQMRG